MVSKTDTRFYTSFSMPDCIMGTRKNTNLCIFAYRAAAIVVSRMLSFFSGKMRIPHFFKNYKQLTCFLSKLGLLLLNQLSLVPIYETVSL
jgi:hypothetical protein